MINSWGLEIPDKNTEKAFPSKISLKSGISDIILKFIVLVLLFTIIQYVLFFIQIYVVA